ncbi:MAG: hypothetical protein NTW08_00215 [Gammaproteobacteria bacterium]|nr:hypothetical protein [Gammaproteobacteria bacterium]
MYTYSAYQFTFSSELFLPELCSVDDSIVTEQPLISLVYGHARRDSVTNACIESLYYSLHPEACWFEIPNITRFLIQQGRHIIVEPCPGVDEESVRLFLYTICIPLVLIYHNFFLLHGGAIDWGGQGVAFLADFGQGKSTILASFLKRADCFLSDDMCVLTPKGEIVPGFAYIQLQEDAIRQLDIDPTELKLTRPAVQKWFVPVKLASDSQPVLLKTIYMLNPTHRLDVQLTPLLGLRKVQYLKKYIYQPLFVKGLGKDLAYFHHCAVIASRTTAIYVERPKQGFSWHEFAHIIEQDMLECL